MPELRVMLLGPPTITIDRRPLRTDTRKATALLAYLAVSEQPRLRGALCALFWPESSEQRARAALRRTLSVLRTALGDRWLDAAADALALEPRHLRVDVREFRHAIARGHLRAAVDLYRGGFMEGFSLRDSPEFDRWQTEVADELRAQCMAALARVAADEEARGDIRAAITYASRRVALDPLHEPAHRELMRLYARADERASALRQYRDCVRLLDSDLGVAPAPETRALHDEIQAGALAVHELPTAVARAEAVGDVHTLHGDYVRAIDSFRAAIASAPATARAALEHKLAAVYHRRGDWPNAERHYAEARRASAVAGDQARILADWSLAAHRAGDPARALRLASEALSLAQRSNDRRALAQAHNILGILRAGTPAALKHLETSVALADQLGDREAHVAALNNLALAHLRGGNLTRARELTEIALAQCEEIGDRHRCAALHNNLADVFRAEHREAEAMRELKRAVRIFSEIGESNEPEIWKLVEW